MAILRQTFGTQPLPIFPLKDGINVIGRHEDCDVVVNSPAVSRQHAHLILNDSRCLVEDLQSRNGTRINGHPVRGRTPLSDGDLLEISTLPFTFHLTDSATDAPLKPGESSSGTSFHNVDHKTPLTRRLVSVGDVIEEKTQSAGHVHAEQIAERLPVSGNGSLPVQNNAPHKLRQTLQLLKGSRRAGNCKELVDGVLRSLQTCLPSARQVAVLLNEDGALQVSAAENQQPGNAVEICVSAVHLAVSESAAVLCVEHGETNGPPENLRTTMAVPLNSHTGRTLGVIHVDTTDEVYPFHRGDLELLVILSDVMSAVLDQMQTLQTVARQTLLERRTTDANHLRRNLSPLEPPEIPGYRIVHQVLPMPDIAADLIDYVRLGQERVACIVVDVPGRGPEAAGQMALLARLLVAAIVETGSAAHALQRAEQTLTERMPHVPLQMSVAVLILDARKSTVTASVAGDCRLMYIHGEDVREVRTEEIYGPPLGTPRDAWVQADLQLSDNDVLLLFTDGITKMTSSDGNQLTDEQLLRMVRTAATAHRSVFDDRLSRQLQQFRNGADLHDDVSFILMNRTPSAGTIDGPAAWDMNSETHQA